MKDQRWRSEGVNGSQLKFLTENLAYVLKSTRTLSLLTRSRPPSYRQAIGLQNWARNCNRDTKRCSQDHTKGRQQKLDSEQFISTRAFHRTLGGRIRETAVGEQFGPQILETFHTVVRDTTVDHLQPIYT
jgi:hypothetical protein